MAARTRPHAARRPESATRRVSDGPSSDAARSAAHRCELPRVLRHVRASVPVYNAALATV